MLHAWLVIIGLMPIIGYATTPLEHLKDKYRAIEAGLEPLPSITTQSEDSMSLPDNDLDFVRIPNGEELILELTFGQHHLGELFAIKTAQGAQVSLTDIIRALNFPVEVNVAELSAAGWIRSPDHRFSLQFQNETDAWNVTSGANQATVITNDINVDGDIYVDVKLLEDWFNLTLEVNYQELSVAVTPKEPIPLEGKLIRQDRFENLHIFSNEPKYRLQEHSYSPLSTPVLDIQFQATATESNEANHSLSVLGANDLAYFNTQYYFAVNDDNEIIDARLSAARYSPDATLLGPLGATEFQFGDIRAARISPLSTDQISRGVRISNTPLSYQGGNSIDLEGDIQPGWDVEIYRNKLLVASDINIQEGRYFFPSLPLIFGSNEIEIVFYGPQGQIQRDYRNYYVTTTSSSAGELRYHVSVVDEGSRLLEQYAENNDEKRDTLINSRISYALTDWFNLYGGIKQYANPEFSQRDETAYGAELSLFGKALFSVDLLEQTNSQYRRKYQLDTQWYNQSISLINRSNRSYDSNNMSWDNSYSQEARITGVIPSLALSYQQSLEYVQNNSQDYYKLINHLGTQIGKSYLSNRLTWLSNNDHLTTGELQLQRYLNGVFWRVGNRYTANPDTRLNSVYTELSGDVTENTSSRLAFSRDFENDNYSTALSLSWRSDKFSLTSRLDYNDHLGWSASLLGQTSIGSTSNKLFASTDTLVNQGSVSVFVYHDRNNNGDFDGDDTPLSGVYVRSEPTIKNATTDESGIAVLPSLTAFKRTDIDLDEASLPDPYMIPRNPGVSVRPSPGVVQRLEIPVVISMEIEGTVKELSTSSPPSPLAYVPIEVVDPDGRVVKTLLSEFDGYYLANDLIPNAYTIRVKQEYLTQNNWLTPKPIQINNINQDVVNSQDIYLRKTFNQSGYSAVLGEFSSIETLSSYWRLLKLKHPILQRFEYFYARHNNKYILYAAFDESIKPAQQVCDLVQPTKCTVKKIRRR